MMNAVDRLRAGNSALSQASVEAELAKLLEKALAAEGEAAAALREAAAEVLRQADAVGAVVDAVAADHRLLPTLVDGLTALGVQFSEFAFVLVDLREAVWQIEESIREHQAARRADQERARQDGLLLLRVVQAVERQETRAASAGVGPAGGDPVWLGCPYMGLVPFEERDAQVFYGRGELVTHLVQRLAEQLGGAGMLLVAGESGAGKSSLLRAGLMPRLAADALGPGSGRWPRRVIRPGSRPVQELALHLADLAGLDPIPVQESLAGAPGEAHLLAARAVRAAVGHGSEQDPAAGRAAENARLILVVDQFEELFTACPDTESGQAERDAFIAALDTAATMPAGRAALPPAVVVAVVRADFLGQLIAFPALKKALDAGPFTVGPMSEAELRQVITGPAAEAGLAAEAALADAVIAELGTGIDPGCGALPLISQALAATWERREGSQLTVRAYRRAGGVSDAVSRSASAAYSGLTREQQETARLVFAQLTTFMPGGQLARRRCSRAELRSAGTRLATDIDAVIASFSAQRLLVLGNDTVEISHDVLLHAWKQLRDWLAEDQIDHALYGRLLTDAQTWDASQRDPAYLYQPGRLAEVDAASARWSGTPARFPPLPALGRAFIQAAHSAAQRAVRRRRAIAAGLMALTLTALAGAGVAWRYAGAARRQEAIAGQQHAIALSRQLAAQSLQTDPIAPLTARRLAVAAWQEAPTAQAGAAITALLTEQQQEGLLIQTNPRDDQGTAVAFSPDGKLLATTYTGDGRVRLWDPATGQLIAAFRPDGLDGIAFSPDGKLLATGSKDGKVQLWDPATGKPAQPPLNVGPGDSSSMEVVGFSKGGDLAILDSHGTARLWNPATGKPSSAPLSVAPKDSYPEVALSTDGNLLAVASSSIRLWDLQTGKPVGRVPASLTRSGNVSGVAINPDGTLLALGNVNGDGNVRLWDPQTGKPAGTLPVDTSRLGGIAALAFSRDGKRLATADTDGYVRLWDPQTGKPASPRAQVTPDLNAFINEVAFSPDGKQLAVADGEGNVRLWDPETGHPADKPFTADSGGIAPSGLTFSPDGKLLAIAGENVQLWDPATGKPAGAPLPASAYMGEVAFSPGGKLLAAADGGANRVQLWDPATGKPAGSLQPDDGITSAATFAFSPDGKVLAAAEPDGTFLAATGEVNRVQLWDPATGNPIGTPLPGGIASPAAVAFSPDGKLLAAADGNANIRLWDPATGKPVGHRMITGAGHSNNTAAVTFSPDGKLLAATDDNGNVRLWNPATSKAVGILSPSGGAAGIAFSPDGKLLATADNGGFIQLWNPVTQKPVGGPLPGDSSATNPYLAGPADAVAFSPDGKLLVSADSDGLIELWTVSVFTDPYAALCVDVGLPTSAEWKQYAPGEPRPSSCR